MAPMNVRLYIDVPLIGDAGVRVAELQALIQRHPQVQVLVTPEAPESDRVMWWGNLSGAVEHFGP
jgi:N-acetyl-gamma-glutamylphosphate reductase